MALGPGALVSMQPWAYNYDELGMTWGSGGAEQDRAWGGAALQVSYLCTG